MATLELQQENNLELDENDDYAGNSMRQDLGARRDYLKKSKNSRCAYDPQKSIKEEW